MITTLRSPRTTTRWALLAWGLAAAAMAGTPDYDAFSDREGNITTEQHGKALFRVLQDPEQVEATFADAERGNPRAKKVWNELEMDYFPDIGRELAEKVSRPPCMVPVARELSGWCVPYWGFIDFLSKEKPGGVRLRKALFDGFEERARQRRLENQLILSVMNAVLGVGVAATAVREAEAAANAANAARAAVPAARTAAKPIDPNKLHHMFDNPEHALDDFVRASGGREQAFLRIEEAANAALRDGLLKPGVDGKLLTGNEGPIINVGGTQVRLIGGRVLDGRVVISSASRRGLP
jgi:hypothetical protein